MSRAIESADRMWRVKIVTPSYDRVSAWVNYPELPAVSGFVIVPEEVTVYGPQYTESGVKRIISERAFRNDSPRGDSYRRNNPNSIRPDDIVTVEVTPLNWTEQ